MSKVFKLEAGKRIYAIGDVHGYVDVLARMHDAIEKDLRAHPIDAAKIIYLGDYIDRGPDSKGVIDLLLERPNRSPFFNHIYLMGNHEKAMLQFIEDPHGIRKDWVKWGGIEAMQSYGVTYHETRTLDELAQDLKEAVPKTHFDFLENLKLMHLEDDYLFVHAGIDPRKKLEEQDYNDLTYRREPFMSHEEYHPHFVVHGHTVSRQGEIDHRHNRLNLDSGLYQGGPLSCAAIEAEEVRFLQAWQ